MANDYYSDRVRGPRPRVSEEVTQPVWEALLALMNGGISSKLFAEDFPIECTDGKGTYACNRDQLLGMLHAEVPELEMPLSAADPPEPLAVLDMVEFLHRHASAASEGNFHSFFEHHHLSFDRAAGRRQFRDDVNRLLARNGIAYELDTDGRIQRLTTAVLQVQLRRRLPPTLDQRFDELLEAAAAKYTDPDPAVRRDGAEKLWDAFERSKTMLDPRKKTGVKKLIAAASRSPLEADALSREMAELTRLGNEFAIRHHETNTTAPSDSSIDYLFARLYALLMHLHPALR